jgi:hypothetical protein
LPRGITADSRLAYFGTPISMPSLIGKG